MPLVAPVIRVLLIKIITIPRDMQIPISQQ